MKMIMEVLKCPKKCGGNLHFKLRLVECVCGDNLGVHDLKCDTCDYELLNIFKLTCDIPIDKLKELIKQEVAKRGKVAIIEIIKEYYIDNKLAIQVFDELYKK